MGTLFHGENTENDSCFFFYILEKCQAIAVSCKMNSVHAFSYVQESRQVYVMIPEIRKPKIRSCFRYSGNSTCIFDVSCSHMLHNTYFRYSGI